MCIFNMKQRGKSKIPNKMPLQQNLQQDVITPIHHLLTDYISYHKYKIPNSFTANNNNPISNKDKI